jgi:hypothetical protein
MVVGDRFAWGHLGKTAGDATLGLFQLFPELIVFADAPTENAKHTRFSGRRELVEGKVLALNIRRLPSWVVSFAIDRAAATGAPLWPAEELAGTDLPDRKLHSWLDDGPGVDHWLRVEHLADDFLTFISVFAPVTRTRRWHVRVQALRRVNAHKYDHRISRWLTRKQLAALYERNPLWKSIEQEMYSGIRLS